MQKVFGSSGERVEDMHNRPKVEDYRINESQFEISGQYVFDLEKYCDVLEKALEKACEKLTTDTDEWCEYDVCPFIFDDYGHYHCGHKCKDKNNWKAWLMKDE